MTFDSVRSPVSFLQEMIRPAPREEALREYERWWLAEGQPISDSVDRAGTPWLRMFDKFGSRVDEILYPPDYWKMLKQGYKAGAVWRGFQEGPPRWPYLLG